VTAHGEGAHGEGRGGRSSFVDIIFFGPSFERSDRIALRGGRRDDAPSDSDDDPGRATQPLR